MNPVTLGTLPLQYRYLHARTDIGVVSYNKQIEDRPDAFLLEDKMLTSTARVPQDIHLGELLVF